MNTSLEELWREVGRALQIRGGRVRVRRGKLLRGELMDRLVAQAASSDPAVRETARFLIRGAARDLGIETASLHDRYAKVRPRAAAVLPVFFCRELSMEGARAVFRAGARGKHPAGAFQPSGADAGAFAALAILVLAAAIREGWRGQVHLQAGFRFDGQRYRADPEPELEAARQRIAEAVAAGYLNFELDASALADRSRPTLEEQLGPAAAATAETIAFIRSLEPEDATIAAGACLPATRAGAPAVEELRAFLAALHRTLAAFGSKVAGLAWVAIAGAAAESTAFQELARVARDEYGLALAASAGAWPLTAETIADQVASGVAAFRLELAAAVPEDEFAAWLADLYARLAEVRR